MSAGALEQFLDLRETAKFRLLQRSATLVIGRVRIGAAIEQQLYGVRPIPERRQHKGAAAIRVPVIDGGAAIEQIRDRRQFARLNGAQQVSACRDAGAGGGCVDRGGRRRLHAGQLR
jgi:hypothetical protein